MNTTSDYIRQNAESKKAIQDQIDKIMHTHKMDGFLIAVGIVLVGVGLVLFI